MNRKKIFFLSVACLAAAGALAARAQAQSADLAVNMTNYPNPIAAGATITYSISVSNFGPDAASTVTLADPFPAGMTFQSLSSPAGWLCSTPAVGAGTEISCSTASLAASSSPSFQLNLKVDPAIPADTVFTNTVTVSSATTDPNPTNNSISASATASVQADLAVTITDSPDPVAAGGTLSYTITLANNGPSVATTVALTDTVSAGQTFAALTSPAGWSCSTPAVGDLGAVDCSIATLGVGASAQFTLDTTVGSLVAADTVITNIAVATTAANDPDYANDSAMAQTTVKEAEACQLQVIPSHMPRLLETLKPLQFFMLIGEEGTVFGRADVPAWGSPAIRHLLKLKLGARAVLELAFVNPFTAVPGSYAVTVAGCAGTFEIR